MQYIGIVSWRWSDDPTRARMARRVLAADRKDVLAYVAERNAIEFPGRKMTAVQIRRVK